MKNFCCITLFAFILVDLACSSSQAKTRQPEPARTIADKPLPTIPPESGKKDSLAAAKTVRNAEKPAPEVKKSTEPAVPTANLVIATKSETKSINDTKEGAESKEVKKTADTAKIANPKEARPVEPCESAHENMMCVKIDGNVLYADRSLPSYEDWLQCVQSKNCNRPAKKNTISEAYKKKNRHRFCTWSGKRVPAKHEIDLLPPNTGFCVTELDYLTQYPSFNVTSPLTPQNANPNTLGAIPPELKKIFLAEGGLDTLDKPFCKHKYTSPAHCRDPVSYLKTNERYNYLFKPHIQNLRGGYVGVGADANYSYIAHARSEYVWLVDFDPKINLLHNILKVFILKNETPAGFVKSFANKQRKESLIHLKAAFKGNADLAKAIALFNKSREMLHDYYETQLYQADGNNGFSWLSRKKQYAYVRSLHLANRIRILPGDLLKDKSLRFIGKSAKEMGITIRLYYPSNAEEFWKYTPDYKKNILSLPFDTASLVIRTVHEISWHRPKGQTKSYWHYVVQGAELYQKRLQQDSYISLEDFRKHRIFDPRSEILSYVDVPHSLPKPLHATGEKRQTSVSGQ